MLCWTAISTSKAKLYAATRVFEPTTRAHGHPTKHVTCVSYLSICPTWPIYPSYLSICELTVRTQDISGRFGTNLAGYYTCSTVNDSKSNAPRRVVS